MVAGRVIQPWRRRWTFRTTRNFILPPLGPAGLITLWVATSPLRREVALFLGGFDENFVHVAYNFEIEFAHRLRANGYELLPFRPLHHLKEPRGGTRSRADHLKTWRPSHTVGAYYCAMRTTTGWRRLRRIFERFLRAAVTRHHLRKPWWIPATVTAEILGLVSGARA